MSQKPPDEQSSSDALPYTQVHRAVKPKAALLAGKLGVTPQHALGSLVEFWDLCAGDQRDLERILDETPPGKEPAIVLSAADVAGRFELASGHVVEPVTLERLGLVEARPDGFRVRGMSRYFEPIKRKVTNRERGSRGGKASALSRAAGQAGGEAGAQAGAQAPAQAGAQAESNQAVSSEQLAVSSKKRSESRSSTAAPRKKPKAQAELPEIIPPAPPAPPREPSRGEPMYALWEIHREEALEALGVGPSPDEHHTSAYINKIFARWFELWAAAPPHPRAAEAGMINGAEWRCVALFEEYLQLDWPAKAVERVDGKDTQTPQPYPFRVLASEKVWGELVAKLYPEEPFALAWPERRERLKRGEA